MAKGNVPQGGAREGPGDGWRDLGQVRPTSSMPAAPTPWPMVTTWPHLLFRELLALLVCAILLVAASLLFNAPLEDPANPTSTPNPAKAPWYFVGLQELLVYFDPWIAGVMIPLIIIFGLCAIPYIDGSRKGEGVYSFRDRPLAFVVFTAGLAGWFVLIAIGSWFRGPGWSWVWPWQPVGSGVPGEPGWSMPNILGVPLLLLFVFGGGWAILRWTRRWPGLTHGRRCVLVFLALAMAGTLLKVLMHALLGMKYFASFGSVGLNF